MNYGLYAVFDDRATIWQPPFVSSNDNSAIRDFMSRYFDAFHGLAEFAGDLKLYKMGDFYPATGKIIIIEPQLLKSGLSHPEDYIL